MTSRGLLQFYLFVVLAIYFVWFWTHGGQTLAMKTWRIRLLGRDGAPVSQGRALARYCLSWLWFLPALLVAWATGSAQLWVPLLGLVLGVMGYAALCFAHPDRQFLHDALCSTRLVSTATQASG